MVVTWEALGSSTGIVVALGLMGFGALSLLAVANTPTPGPNAGKGGCLCLIAGAVVFVASCAVMIFA